MTENFYKIEKEIKELLNNNSHNNNKQEQDIKIKELLFKLKSFCCVSVEYLAGLINNIAREDNKKRKVKRLLERLHLKTKEVITTKQVLTWRKWKGEIKDFSYNKDGTISLLTKEQYFGHQIKETATKVFNVIVLE